MLLEDSLNGQVTPTNPKYEAQYGYEKTEK